jgi:hypothetical protein
MFIHQVAENGNRRLFHLVLGGRFPGLSKKRKSPLDKVHAGMIRRVEMPVRVNQMSVGGNLSDRAPPSGGADPEKPESVRAPETERVDSSEDVIHESPAEDDSDHERDTATGPRGLAGRRRNSWNVGPRTLTHGSHHQVNRTATLGL